MNLIKRIDKGPYSDKTIGITGPEHDANLTEIEEKFVEIDDKITNAENGEALISVNSEAAMTAKWTELDAAGKTPVDGRELFRTDLNQYWKWNSAEPTKGEFSRNNIEEATAQEQMQGSSKFSNDGDLYNKIQSEITDPIDAKVTETNAKTDNLLNKDNEFGVADNNGKIGFKVDDAGANAKVYNILDENGVIQGSIDKALYDSIIAKLAEGSLENIIDSINYKNAFVIVDALNKMGLKYDADGFDVAKLSEHFKSLLNGNNTSVIQVESSFDGNYAMNIVYGQSLALGGIVNAAENFYTSKTFTNGVKVDQSYTDTTDANNEGNQEARFGGITDMASTGNSLNARFISKIINELIVLENGKDLATFNHNQFGFVAGISGGQWYQLTKWNSSRNTQFVDVQPNSMPTALSFTVNGEGKAYLNLMQAIYFANKFAKADGKKLTVSTVSYIQGEASAERDDTVTEFKAKLNALFDDITADVTTITGQAEAVKFITYQNASFALYKDPNRPEYDANAYTEGVPLAMVEITKDRADTFLGTPLYPYSPTVANSGDLIHLQDLGYALMSSLIGIVAKKVVNNSQNPKLLEPIIANVEIWQSGANWYTYIPFNVETKPLVFDTEGVSGVNMRGHGLQPNYGFSILNGSSTEIITNVALSSDDAIVITTNEDPTGLDLTYALTGAMGGGNLRDSQGDKITTEFNGTTYRCDNWCPFFRITL